MIRRASARLSASPFRARQAASGRATAALLVALLLALGLAARLGFGLLDLAAPQAVAPAIADTAMAASTPVDLPCSGCSCSRPRRRQWLWRILP